MSKWERSYPGGHLVRILNCREYCVDDNHTVMIIRHDNEIDSYVMEHDGNGNSTPFLFMFGHEAGTVPYSQIVEMTICNAPNFYYMFEEE